MKKTLVGVLSVAGLLAVVLALASGPAAAAKKVVTIKTSVATTSEAGTYTVDWSTRGGCDPGEGTSRTGGRIVLVVADADGSGSETTGPTQEDGITTDTDCTYDYKATLLRASDGARCKVTFEAADNGATQNIVYDSGNAQCNTVEKVTFTVEAHDSTVPPKATVAGAVKNASFTVTATQKVAAGATADPECVGVSEDTAVSDAGNNQVELSLVDTSLGGTNCVYNVTAALPAGFAEGAKGSNSAVVYMNGTPSDGSDPADNRATVGSAGTSTVALSATLTVAIATPTVYLVQNVIGDAGDARVQYTYSASCGAPGLPGAIGAKVGGGGIITTPSVTVVELIQGRFNVSAAIGDRTAGGTKAAALDDKANACEAAVSVTGVPAGCSVTNNSPVALTTAGDSAIIEFTIDCTPGATSDAAGADAGDTAGGDMTGDGDDGGDMMDGGGDMTDLDGGGDMMDDGDDTGPGRDMPTG